LLAATKSHDHNSPLAPGQCSRWTVAVPRHPSMSVVTRSLGEHDEPAARPDLGYGEPPMRI